ncbi:aspartate/glutamate racemase family protein [Demetria terragena]|uniref:aspartate/glutamate racemase family protein n=1 Tax=Demetria terragena TaxID=63959 RepID=UPI00036942DB|nr:amino acid racemase [Demetria terragena]
MTFDARVSPDQGWADPVVGVMGGMGPLAGATFLRVLTLLTKAASDQEHVDAILLSHATTPDRTAALTDPNAADPSPVLLADAQRLEHLGAQIVAVPCNSAHPFMRGLSKQVSVPLIDIVDVTARAAAERVRATGKPPTVGVLATEGTRAAGLYRSALENLGMVPVDATDAEQRVVTHLIYDQVKAGQASDIESLLGLVEGMVANGCSTVILGCTELSVAYDEHGLHRDARIVDSVESLARETLRRVGRAAAR